MQTLSFPCRRYRDHAQMYAKCVCVFAPRLSVLWEIVHASCTRSCPMKLQTASSIRNINAETDSSYRKLPKLLCGAGETCIQTMIHHNPTHTR